MKCIECDSYNHETHSCPKWCDIVRNTVEDAYHQGRQDAIAEISNDIDEIFSSMFLIHMKLYGLL